ncbi:30S ribosome-binding factor RbfA [Pirellulaceae bacterium SH449]
MTARRVLKAGEAIREVVSMAILTEIRDPRVKNVTVLGVEVAPDMREAKVVVSIMGNKTQQSTSMKGLQNSAGFLQAKIADRIDTRYTPKLRFVLDDGVKKSMAVSQILEQLAAERAETAAQKGSLPNEQDDSSSTEEIADLHDDQESPQDLKEDSVDDDGEQRPTT